MRPGNEPIGPIEGRWQPLAGQKGDKGEKGDRGQPGLSLRVRRALVFLFVLPSLIAAAAAVGVVIQTRAYQAGQRREQAQQAQQGRQIESKLCRTFGTLAALKPPPGNPAKNPSRAYLQGLHARLDDLGRDLGCQVKEAP